MRKIKIPFDKNGNHMKFPLGDIEWKDNHEFQDTMTLSSIVRGCSAANFILIGKDNKRYTMFMKDLFDACVNGIVKNGKIKGTFCYVKRGRNYGVMKIN